MAVTQQQIADLAGVSRATVDRVVNGRGHVDPEVEKTIRQIIEEQGYIPNRAGSLLQRARRPLQLGVIIQSVGTPFLGEVLEHIEQARMNMRQQGAELHVMRLKRMDAECQLEQLEKMERLGVDGLAITPTEDPRVCEAIDRFVAKGVPVVTFNTDMPESKRLCYVGQNNILSGQTCASLMGTVLGGKGKVFVVTGYENVRAQQERVNGFCEELRREYPAIELLDIETSCEDDDVAYSLVMEALQKDPTINGLYLTSDGPSGACRAICDMGFEGKVHFICHDATKQNTKNMLAGLIDFIIDQNAFLQANKPLQILIDKLIAGEQPEREFLYTLIDIRNKHNIESDAIFQ